MNTSSFVSSRFLSALLILGVIASSVLLPAPTARAAENLILNPSLETGATLPDSWAQGSWGTHNAAFTYGAPAQDGSKGGTVTMASYTSGDAKWYFNDVPVTAGTVYSFSDWYQGTAATQLVVRYQTSGGAFSYAWLADVPVSASWAQTNVTFTPPAGTVSVTVFHLLHSTGTLSVDTFSLSSGTTPPPAAPTCTLSVSPASIQSGSSAVLSWSTTNATSLSVDNGVGSVALSGSASVSPTVTTTYTGMVSDSGGTTATCSTTLTVTATPPTPPPSGSNLISNPSLETDADSNGIPDGWAQGGWGTMNAVYSNGAPAQEGSKGGAVTVTGYASGDAKWYFTDVPVTAGTQYTFKDWYQSNTASQLVARYTASGGAVSYVWLADVAAAATWTEKSITFVPPSGTASVTIFHIIYSNGTLSVDNYSLSTDTTPPPNAPTCSMSASPSTISEGSSATLSWTTANTSVFSIDQGVGPASTPTGAISVSPSVTTTYTGTATGAGAGTATCNTTLTVTAVPPPDPNNLVVNPSLENGGTSPDFWGTGGWGTNNAAYTYPVAGIDGARAAKVAITSYTSGDAKWVFNDVPVTAGTLYAFSDRYIGTVPTQLTARYKSSSGVYSYAFLATVPASASWGTAAATFTPPAGTVAVSIFHILYTTGSLTVDDLHLAPGAGTPAGDSFDKGYVSLTFDDGWYSQYVHALPLLNQFGLKGSFYIITNEMKNAPTQIQVPNPSFETAGIGGVPLSWQKSKTGTNNAVQTYPVAGIDGAKAVQTTITSYTSGDAKWTFNPLVMPDAGDPYEYSDQYKATTATELVARYTMTNGSTTNIPLGTVPASTNWSVASVRFTPPDGARSVAVYHVLKSAGTLTVDDVKLFPVEGYMKTANATAFQTAGHEVSAHTRTHPDLTTLSTSAATTEIQGSRTDLTTLNFTPVDTFVYPYGTYNPSIINIVQNAGFIGARTTNRGFNNKTTPMYELLIQEINPSTTVEEVKTWIDTANVSKTWLILMYHEIDHTGLDYSTTPEKLKATLQYLKDTNTSVITMHDGLLLPRGASATSGSGSDTTPAGESSVSSIMPQGSIGPVQTTPSN